MRTFATKQKPKQVKFDRSMTHGRVFVGQNHVVRPILQLQRTIGNQSVQRLLQATDAGLNGVSVPAEPTRFSHDFNQVPIHQKAGKTIQPKLMVSTSGDQCEREADRVAYQVMRMPEPLAQRNSVNGGEPLGYRQDDGNMDLNVQRLDTGGRSNPEISPGIHNLLRSPGKPLDPLTRAYFEPRFGRCFGHVRVHTDRDAAETAQSLNARAFTLGAHIVFGSGEYSPYSNDGRHMLAHELTHVVQQAGSTDVVQRDLAVQPPNPGAVPVVLTSDERREALEYNRLRFEDPFTIRIIRDVIGITPTPAVIDNDFVSSLLQWQADHNLEQDGKFGPITGRTVVRELRAEGMNRLARLLRTDNFVQVRTVNGPTYNTCTGPGGEGFRWDVGFRTSLRNGFIVQRIDNAWNETPPAGQPAIVQTARYWEAWSVNSAGNVNPSVGNINDMWTRITRPGSRGNWRMRGTLFTVLNLSGAAGFAVNNVPDAGNLLQSTATRPTGLGLPEGFLPIDRDERSRTIGGEWNCTNPVPANRFHRRV